MKKLKLYFDTTIFNFAFADDAPQERAVTLNLIKAVKNGEYDAYVSDVVVDEISKAPEEKARKLMELLTELEPVGLEFDEECRELASEYIKRGIIPRKYEDDAFHIAVATVNNLDAIISWNFEHIVKLKTKREVTGTNLLLGYRELEIYSPLEVKDNE